MRHSLVGILMRYGLLLLMSALMVGPFAWLLSLSIREGGNIYELRLIPSDITFDTSDLGRWDSSVLAFLAGVSKLARDRGVALDRSGLSQGLRRLLALAEYRLGRPDQRLPDGEGRRAVVDARGS